MSDLDLGYSSLILPPQSQQSWMLFLCTWWMDFLLQPLSLPLHGDLLSLGVQPRLGRNTDKLWLGFLCPGDTPGTKAMHSSPCVLHTTIAPWKNHGNLCWCPGGHTQLQGVEGFKPTLGMLQWLVQGKEHFLRCISPNFSKYVLNIWFMPYLKYNKFRAAENSTLPENLFQQLCGEFSLNGEKDQRKFIQMNTWQKEL